MTWLAGISLPSPSPSGAPGVFATNPFSYSFLLSTIVWVPVLWALVLAFAPNPRGRYDRFFYGSTFWIMLLVEAGLSLIGYMQFSSFSSGLQFEEKLPWLPAFGISYHLGADGISMVVLMLNSLVGVAAVLASSSIRVRPRAYFVLLLLTESAVNGLACARDLFLMWMFFAAAAIPVALLIAGWGTAGPRRGLAASRLLAYWGLGALALLAAVLLLISGSGVDSLDFDAVARTAASPRLQVVAGLLVVAACATRLPLFPLHGWTEALAEAPAGVAIIVAGAAARSGGYVLLRLLDASLNDATRLLAPLVAVLAGFTVVYAALAALRTVDIRRAGAYLAIVPGAVTVLGLSGVTPLSIDGAALSLFTGGMAAGLIAGVCNMTADFALVRDFRLLGGLAGRTPRLYWLLVVAGFGVACIPLTGNFIALLMVLFGSFRVSALGALLLGAGLLLAAGAVAWLLHRVMMGAPHPDAPVPADAGLTETWALGLLAGALLWVGIFPGGPKLAGVPVFDPGMTNVVNAAVSDLASPYAPPAPQAGAPR